MSDLSIHPVYLSARAAIIAPERAVPVTLYSAQKWLPRLGPERWCLVVLLRALCVDAPRRGDGTKRVTCSWRDLAEMLHVHEETVASWLKHDPLPNDKPWRAIIPADDQSRYLALFIPRLRYAYETYNGKTRRVGFLLEVLMEDPVVPEDEVKLRQQVDLLRMQQGELGLETYRLTPNVSRINSDLQKITGDSLEPQKTDLPYVKPLNLDLPLQANSNQMDLHKSLVNQEFTDLLPSVKQNNSNSDSYVNLQFPNLHEGKSEEAGKNVNKLDILINQLKQTKLPKNSRKQVFEPIIQLTADLLEDDHSGAMFYKVLNALYPHWLDLYVTAVKVALETVQSDPQVNQGAVFVRTLRNLAEEVGVNLGLKQISEGDIERRDDQPLGTQVPSQPFSLPVLTPPSIAEAIWAEAQALLRPQMTRATYDAVIQGTMLMDRENGTYVIGVSSEMAKEWLENRLKDIVRRALSSVVGVSVEVEFKFWHKAL